MPAYQDYLIREFASPDLPYHIVRFYIGQLPAILPQMELYTGIQVQGCAEKFCPIGTYGSRRNSFLNWKFPITHGTRMRKIVQP